MPDNLIVLVEADVPEDLRARHMKRYIYGVCRILRIESLRTRSIFMDAHLDLSYATSGATRTRDTGRERPRRETSGTFAKQVVPQRWWAIGKQ